MRGSIDMEQKGWESDNMLDPLCNLERWLVLDFNQD